MSLIKTDNFDEVISFAKSLNKVIIVTRGAKGSMGITGSEVFEIPAKKNLKIVDLTGAGDLFAAGFLNGYIKKMTISDCLEEGTKLSSKVIQILGARI
jgi:fructokinase